MAAEYVEGIIQGSSMEAQPLTRKRTISGLVKNIDTVGTPDHAVMDKAVAAVTAVRAWGSQYPVNSGDTHDPDDHTVLVKILVFPITYNQCRVQLVYDLSDFIASETSFLIRDSAYLQGWQGNVLPGTQESIRTGWEENRGDVDPDTGSSWDTPPARVPEDYIPMSFSLPVRTITVTAVVMGTPPPGLADLDGYANDIAWYGKGKGFWRVERIETETSDLTAHYSFVAVISTRIYKDWSETGILRNRQTGRYVPVDQTELEELLSRDYDYGVMQGGVGDREGKAGIVRVGPHPLLDFAAYLGFDE